MKLFYVATFVALAAVGSAAFAAQETSAIASPKCDAEKLKKIGGDGIVKVEKGAWEGGFNVTLDTSKLTATDLTKKMMEGGCF